MSYQRILCPIDFSDGARAAIQVAAHLAADRGAELVLAHTFHLPPFAGAGEYPVAPETIDLLVTDAEAMLADAAVEARRGGATQVSTKLLRGVPWSEIVSAGAASDLIVMGTHGRTGVGRFLIGSVAEQVVRHASCDVLVVRAGATAEPYAHVLCPVDFSEPSRAAVQRAAEMVSRRGSITLLHVVELPTVYSHRVRLPAPTGLAEQAAKLLETWAAPLRAKGVEHVVTAVRTGDPSAEILAAISADATIDLCVTGSRGRTGIRRMLLGSVAEKAVRLARCACLVVHAGDRS